MLLKAVAAGIGLLTWVKQGRMTYDLRRLRLRGLIERIPRTRRCRAYALPPPAVVDASVVVAAAEAPRRELAVGDAERTGQQVVAV